MNSHKHPFPFQPPQGQHPCGLLRQSHTHGGGAAAIRMVAAGLLVLSGGAVAAEVGAQAAASAQAARAKQASIRQAGQTHVSSNISRSIKQPKHPADSQHPLYWLERWHHAVAQHPYVGTVTVVQAQGRPRSARVWHGVRGQQQIDRIDLLHAGRPHRTLVRSGQNMTVWELEPRPPAGQQPGLNKDMDKRAGTDKTAGKNKSPGKSKGPRHHDAHDMPQVGAPFSPAGHMDAAQLSQATQYYRVVPLGQQQVARHVADAIGFLPVDEWRAPYRFWTEPQTGLLIKWQMLELRGRDAAAWQQAQVLREMAFEDLQVPAPVDFAMLQSLLHMPPAQAGQGGGQGHQMLQPSQSKRQQKRQPKPPRLRASSLQAQGWAWRQPLPGYVVKPCHWRKLGADPHKAEPGAAAPAAAHDARLHQPVLHCLVTDGLSRFSLFIGPHVPVSAQPSHALQDGRALSRGGGVRMARRVYGNSHAITAVGAVPQAALQQAVDALYRP